MAAREIEQHPGLRLATLATVSVIVRANPDFVDRNRFHKFGGHAMQHVRL
jgi:hypothetical protein